MHKYPFSGTKADINTEGVCVQPSVVIYRRLLLTVARALTLGCQEPFLRWLYDCQLPPGSLLLQKWLLGDCCPWWGWGTAGVVIPGLAPFRASGPLGLPLLQHCRAWGEGGDTSLPGLVCAQPWCPWVDSEKLHTCLGGCPDWETEGPPWVLPLHKGQLRPRERNVWPVVAAHIRA